MQSIRAERSLLLVLFFLSGAAALVYEVLWLKELGLLFGNTAYAAATTLAVFFLGMACGGWVFGRRAGTLRYPLRTYALLEWGIAASALLYFGLMPAFGWIYAGLYGSLGGVLALATLVKFVLAVGILFLPAFFMGGTLPVMGQHLIRRSSDLGRTGTLLYAVNTVGATVGALSAGFFLPPILGFTRSYLVAIVLNVVVGLGAWVLARAEIAPATTPEVMPLGTPPAAADARPDSVRDIEAPPDEEAEAHDLAAPPDALTASAAAIRALAFLSGFLVLALEVLWTRMFAQVLHNSVYSFAAILVTFLLALTLGSVVANQLSRLRTARPGRVLAVLSVVSFVLVLASPLLFVRLTNGLAEMSSDRGWGHYLLRVYGLAAVVMLVPGIVIGSIYPYLLKVSEWVNRSAGRTIGHLAAVNSVGGILGSVLAGFVLLGVFGLWGSVWLLAAGYLAVGVVALGAGSRVRAAVVALAVVGGVYAVLVFVMPSLPVVRIVPGRGERIVEYWESGNGTVVVISQGQDRWIKVNNHYVLGGVDAFASEQRQTQLPLFVQPEPRSVYFLGMGTGITAGAALDFPVERVVTCELVPEVVTAARKHFRDHINGLFEDPRSVVVAEDGRHFLLGTRETFDVIISDLFIPWRAGTGSLYTREHFDLVRSRLNAGGLFVQWVPATQLSRTEFDILVRTVLEVFPHVTMWRGEFIPDWPTLGFLCTTGPTQLDPEVADRNLAHVIPERAPDRITQADIVPYIHYAGNLGAARALFEEAPINTDDRPRIEYMAPRTQQRAQSGEAAWLKSYELLALFDEVATAVPFEEDPYLARLNPEQLGYVRAGLQLHTISTHVQAGRIARAAPLYRDLLEQIPLHIYPGLENQ